MKPYNCMQIIRVRVEFVICNLIYNNIQNIIKKSQQKI